MVGSNRSGLRGNGSGTESLTIFLYPVYFIRNLNKIRVMHNAVKEGIGNLPFREPVIPPHWCEMGAEDGGCLVVAGMDDLQ